MGGERATDASESGRGMGFLSWLGARAGRYRSSGPRSVVSIWGRGVGGWASGARLSALSAVPCANTFGRAEPAG